MRTTTPIPVTQNETWGFYGAMSEQASNAWPQACTVISNATGQSIDSVRAFLDSSFGRHFADDVHNALDEGKTLQDAIHAATGRWMGWTIGRQTSKQYGIPVGLPYLTGFVIYATVMEDIDD